MLVADIVRRVRDIAGDQDVFQFTNSMVVDWINDGVRQIALDNNLLQKRATSTCGILVGEYELPPDIFKLYSIMVDGRKVMSMTLQEYEAVSGDDQASGVPTKFYIWANKITLWPIPDATYKFEINYISDPGDIVAVGNSFEPEAPVVPSSYHVGLVSYCLAKVAQQDGNDAQYAQLMADFNNNTLQLRHQQETEEDLYPFISVSPRDAGGYDEAYYG